MELNAQPAPKSLLHCQVVLAGLWIREQNAKESESQPDKINPGAVIDISPWILYTLTG
jgi:hypothetical protein